MPQLRDPSSSAPGRGTLCSSQAARLRRSLSRYLFRSYRFPALRPTPARRSSDLPIRFRPAFLGLTFLQLILLALLGFHPTLGGQLGVNDKLQHFFGLGIAAALFYWIFEVEDNARRRHWLLRELPEVLTGIVCFVGGGFFSEIVQSMLPYKTFQWGDILANLLGCSLGLYISRTLARRRRHRRELATLYQPLDDLDDASSDLDRDDAAATGPEMMESPTDRKSRQRENDVWDADSDVFSLGGDEEEDTPQPEQHQQRVQQQAAMNHGQAPV